MGIPICMTALPPADINAVRQELRTLAEDRGGEFKPGAGRLAPERRMVIGRGEGGRITIFFPKGYVDCDQVARRLSDVLNAAAFSFKLDNNDGWWAYKLYAKGAEVDRFSPRADYFAEEEGDKSGRHHPGSPTSVVVHWRAGAGRDIEKYYVDLKARDCKAKAYPTDEATQCDEWQLLDFMKKLRIPYPIDERGNALGAEYHFDWGR